MKQSPNDMIKVASLAKRFNGFTAVDQISFEVSASEIFWISWPKRSLERRPPS